MKGIVTFCCRPASEQSAPQWLASSLAAASGLPSRSACRNGLTHEEVGLFNIAISTFLILYKVNIDALITIFIILTIQHATRTHNNSNIANREPFCHIAKKKF